MRKIILKRHPDRLSFKEKSALLAGKVFKQRTFMVSRDGRIAQYSFSSSLQCLLALLFAAFLGWTLFATKIYISTKESREERDAQVRESHDKFNAVVADVRAYRDTVASLSAKLSSSHENAINLAVTSGKISKSDKDSLMKERVRLSAELAYVGAQLDNFSKTVSWETQSAEGSYKATKNELEKNLVLNENISLKKRNVFLEKSVSDMSELQNNLIDKVQVLAKNGLGDIEKVLSQVDIILSQVNLKNRDSLAARAAAERADGLGGSFIPLKDISLNDTALDARFKEANKTVNLWEGLDKVKTMLPLGAPIRDDIRITSAYGIRNDPFENIVAMHSGIDFGGAIGTPLYSTAKGKVIFAGNRGDYGLCIEVYHGMGFSTLYGHLSKIMVKNGDMIEEGSRVGLAGSSGRSTASHLHYELRHNGRPLNPYAFIKAKE